MPRTLSIGMQGADVRDLQERLNALLPQQPLLDADGMFGPKTLARVKAFQSANGLEADGIVGPLTWGVLNRKAETPPGGAAGSGFRCGCADHHDRGLPPQLLSHAKEVAFPMLTSAPSGKPSFGLTEASAESKAVNKGHYGRVTPAMRAILDPVYGDSISYAHVFITAISGYDNRAVVLTVKAPMGGPLTAVQYVNLGTSYSNHTLIHEFGHVWQSQHHTNPTAYMVNAGISQAAEAGLNLKDGPRKWSAYAYKPGKNIAQYGAEQMAQMIADGDKDMRAYVRLVPKLFIDPFVIPAPAIPFVERIGAPGVVGT
jgi:hypothetical protein